MTTNSSWTARLDTLLDELNLQGTQTCKGLILSASDGQSRALARSQPGDRIDEALSQAARYLAQSFVEPPKHLRLDVIVHMEPTTWGKLQAAARQIKRNYFRLGLALDESCEQTFLETELNAFACFNAGAEVHHCEFNSGNFAKLYSHRFGDVQPPEFNSDTPIWTFSTHAAYCGEDEQAHLLESSGLDIGRRHIMPLRPADTLDLITQSSEFLGRMVQPGGEFIYGFFPCFDRRVAGYNTLRHSSSTYSMLEAWEVTKSPELKAAIDRSINRMVKDFIKVKEIAKGVTAAFLLDTGNEIKLGGNAVAILALVKYCQLTGDRTHEKLAQQLGTGIAAMLNTQTGQFVHVLNYPDLSIKEQFRIIYYDGEAAFALMRLYELTRNHQWVDLVEKAFEYFLKQDHWKAHDHWLSYCVNELTRIRPNRKYFEFGLKNVSGYLDFVLERITTFPTLLELMMAAEQMVTRLEGMPEHADLLAELDLQKFYRALHHRAHYLLNGFFWPELAMFYQVPDSIQGGFFIRHHAFRVRNDDIEHYLSGFVAYRKFLIGNTKQGKTKLLTTKPVRKPFDLAGLRNGHLPAQVLKPIRWGYLHDQAARAWNAMEEAALADGIVLLPVSPADTYRPFQTQEAVFLQRHVEADEGKVRGKDTLPYAGKNWRLKPGLLPSSVPGFSAHGWGLAVDVMLDDRCGYILDWLRDNAERFGFCWQLQEEAHHLVFYPSNKKGWAIKATENQFLPLWSSEGITQATQGKWIRLPSPAFKAAGVCTYAPAFKPGQLLVLKGTEEQKGIVATVLGRLATQASGVILQAQVLMEMVPKDLPVLLVEDNQKAVFRLAQAHRREFAGRVIGVTGSAGKTTVSHMIHAMANGNGGASVSQSNGNLPFGVAWNICAMDLQHRYWVTELAIGGMKDNTLLARPDIAVLTNIGDSHLIYHKDRKTVAERKSRILYGLPASGKVVLNIDTPHVDVFTHLAERLGLQVITCGASDEAEYQLVHYDTQKSIAKLRLQTDVVELDLSHLPGSHMAMNTLISLAAADAAGVPRETSLSGLAGFKLLAGRGELIEVEWPEVGGVKVIDDSYNANPESMIKSIQAVAERFRHNPANRLVLVLGDMLELGEDEVQLHQSLLEYVNATGAELVITCGPRMESLYSIRPSGTEWAHFANSEACESGLQTLLRARDLVFVKGSNGSGLYRMIQKLRAKQ